MSSILASLFTLPSRRTTLSLREVKSILKKVPESRTPGASYPDPTKLRRVRHVSHTFYSRVGGRGNRRPESLTLGSGPCSNRRGNSETSNLYPGVDTVHSYHPSMAWTGSESFRRLLDFTTLVPSFWNPRICRVWSQ